MVHLESVRDGSEYRSSGYQVRRGSQVQFDSWNCCTVARGDFLHSKVSLQVSSLVLFKLNAVIAYLGKVHLIRQRGGGGVE